MPKLILLNGAINCGKLTVGNLIKSTCTNIAFIEVDDLNNFISWMPIDDAYLLNITNAISIARNFIADSIDVIIAYPLTMPIFAIFRQSSTLNVK